MKSRRKQSKHVPGPSKPGVSGSSPLGRASSLAERMSKWRPTLESRLHFFTDDRPHADGCHRWTGYRSDQGYGVINVDRKPRLVHRVVWELANGADASGLVIRHLCSHPWCVNPRHLRAGTHADNVRDKVIAGRQAKGSGNGRAKLTEEVVRDVVRRLASGERKSVLAREFGVSERALRFIETGKAWAHVLARPEQGALLEVAP